MAVIQSEIVYTLRKMKALETLIMAAAVVLFIILISLPGIGISYLGWRFSRSLRRVSAQTVFRTGVIAVATTPSVWDMQARCQQSSWLML
jgi:hypothetical protein